MISSFYDVLMSNKQFFGILTYIGIFLGLVFFLATGSIIYFKQLMEASEDRQRYLTLRYIGVKQGRNKRNRPETTICCVRIAFSGRNSS